jgi:hypothetical protein
MDATELQEIDELLALAAQQEELNILSDWEVKFFNDTAYRRELYGDKFLISSKQYAKLKEMAFRKKKTKHKYTIRNRTN